MRPTHEELVRTNVVIRRPGGTQELEETSRAVAAADERYLREALESVDWERRGWLGRLVRVERPAAQIERGTKARD